MVNTRLAMRKNRGGQQGQEYPFTLRAVEGPEPDEDGEPLTTMVIDWLPSGAAGTASPPSEDQWIAGCRQEEQRAAMSRLKRVLLAALAEHGVELPIPSPTPVPNSTPIGDPSWGRQLGTIRSCACNQETVRQAFYLCTPGDPRQTQYNRFARTRDRAEQRGLISAGNIDGVTYLWLSRPDPGTDEE